MPFGLNNGQECHSGIRYSPTLLAKLELTKLKPHKGIRIPESTKNFCVCDPDETFCLWNPESWAVESGKAQGIRNPTNHGNQKVQNSDLCSHSIHLERKHSVLSLEGKGKSPAAQAQYES